jgi:bacterioferritin-associated ferredoxin
MAATPYTTEAVFAEPPRRGRAMTRCECTGVAFSEIARQLREEGKTFEDVARRTGCGGNCTACLPDLEAFLARD